MFVIGIWFICEVNFGLCILWIRIKFTCLHTGRFMKLIDVKKHITLFNYSCLYLSDYYVTTKWFIYVSMNRHTRYNHRELRISKKTVSRFIQRFNKRRRQPPRRAACCSYIHYTYWTWYEILNTDGEQIENISLSRRDKELMLLMKVCHIVYKNDWLGVKGRGTLLTRL